MTDYSHRIGEELLGVTLFVASIWIVFGLDLFLPLEQLALLPRHISGLIGIVAMPFLHSNWAHLLANSTPLIVMLILLAGSRANSTVVVTLIILLGGTLHWFFGRPAYVIGASGLVFGLMGYLIASGLFERRLVPLLISLIVGLLYGSTLITGVLPNQPGVSWDGHLFGAIAGVVVAFFLTRGRQTQ
ncbi:MAG: rhomboid family intramembrane serine protease [Pseudomonadota bacterium]